LGTMKKNSLQMDHRMTEGYNIPNQAHWFWPSGEADAGGTPQIAVFKFKIPGTMKDTPTLGDTSRCAYGPIIRSMSNVVQPCSKKVDGADQGPGTYTNECIRAMFLSSGCTTSGHAYPSNQEKIGIYSGNGSFNRDKMKENANELFNVSKKGESLDGSITITPPIRMKATMDCFGKIEGTVCNPFNEATPPMPLSPECLDYLWQNKGRNTDPTYTSYTGATPINSGTSAPFSTACPASIAAGLTMGVAEVSPSNAGTVASVIQKAAETHASRAIQYAKNQQIKEATESSNAASAAWNAAKAASKLASK
jgi:hypothetical protein